MTRIPSGLPKIMLGAVVAIAFGMESQAANQGGSGGGTAASGLTLLAQAGVPDPHLSAESLMATVHAAGFKDITRIGFEHGRYEIKVVDPKRARTVEVFIDPKTRQLITDPKTGKVVTHPVATHAKPAGVIPFEDIAAKVKAEGFIEIKSIEYEHAMYEIQAHDSQGQLVELYYLSKKGDLLRHPKTGKARFEVLK